MNQILSFFAKLDTFPVAFTQTIGMNNQQIFYKSAFGGMVTIIILTFALIYSIDELYSWGSGNKIHKVLSQRKYGFDEQIGQLEIFSKNTSYENYLEFYILSNNNSMFLPFYSDEAIMIPLMINYKSFEVQSLLENYDLQNRFLNAQIQNFQNNDYVIIFANCIGNEQYLMENQKCANQSLVDQFYQEKGLEIFITLYSEKMDYSIDQRYDLYSTLNIPIEQQSAASIDLFFEYEVLNIQKGLLFQENEKHILRSDYSAQTQFISNKYLTNYMEYYLPIKSVFLAIWIGKDYNYMETKVQYPSVSESLANIASITQTLFLIRYFITWINRTHMYESLRFNLGNIYYPELKQIIKIKTGKQKKYFFNDQEIENSSYKNFKQKLHQMICKKLDYVSLIKEIYLMQKLLYQLSSQQQIINIIHDCEEKIILTQIDENKFQIENFCQNSDQYTSLTFDPFIFCRKIPDKQQKGSEISVINSKKEVINIQKNDKYQKFKNKFMSDHQIVY